MITTNNTMFAASRRERLTWLSILEEPMGYVDGQNSYQFVQSDPAGNLDPYGLFTGEYHTSITRDGLRNSGLSEKCINSILRGNLGQDAGIGFMSKVDHGDNGPAGIKATIDKMSERLKSIFDGRNKCESCKDVDGFLREFGKILHAIQDLYSHSNYVEVANAAAGGSAVSGDLPLWEMTVGPNNASNIPPGITSGSFSGMSMVGAGPGTHGAMAHDTPDYPASQVTNFENASMFDLARDLAARHTAAAWAEFHRQMAGSKAWEMLGKCCKEGAATQPGTTRPSSQPVSGPSSPELLK